MRIALYRALSPDRSYQAADRDVQLTPIMDVTRHKDVRTVTGYVRRATLFKGPRGFAVLIDGETTLKAAIHEWSTP
jgi:hypothetical protein